MNTTEDWWSDFFKGPFGELQVSGSHRDTTVDDVDWIERTLGKTTRRILDAPCGAGRHSLELARRGHSVVGIDFNPAVLEAAAEKAQAQSLDVDFVLDDLRKLNSDEEYDAVTCLWGSIGYFSDEDNAKTLRNLAEAVKPGGYLFLDTLSLESLCEIFVPRDWGWAGEGEARVRVCEERRFDPETSRVEVTWSFIGCEGESVRETSIRIYSCHELIAILKDAGLSKFTCTGNRGEAFNIGSSRLWLSAQKSAST